MKALLLTVMFLLVVGAAAAPTASAMHACVADMWDPYCDHRLDARDVNGLVAWVQGGGPLPLLCRTLLACD